jgi:hypothetical protein
VGIEAAKLREATEPLVRDLQATLAWDRARARSEVDWWLRIAVDGLGLRFGPSDPQLAADDEKLVEAVVVRAAEDFQKWAHETFVDTSWPSCLRHGRHPMSLGSADDGSLAWCRPQDAAVMVGLGMLGGQDETGPAVVAGRPTHWRAAHRLNAGPDPAVLLIASTPRPLPSQLVISARPGRAAGARPSAPGAPGRATRG